MKAKEDLAAEGIRMAAERAALGVVRACVGRGLVGDASLAEQIGEAARCAGVVDALQRVGANTVGRSRLAALAGRKRVPFKNSKPPCAGPMVGANCHGIVTADVLV